MILDRYSLIQPKTEVNVTSEQHLPANFLALDLVVTAYEYNLCFNYYR